MLEGCQRSFFHWRSVRRHLRHDHSLSEQEVNELQKEHQKQKRATHHGDAAPHSLLHDLGQESNIGLQNPILGSNSQSYGVSSPGLAMPANISIPGPVVDADIQRNSLSSHVTVLQPVTMVTENITYPSQKPDNENGTPSSGADDTTQDC